MKQEFHQRNEGKECDYSNTEIAYDVSELGYENCIR